MEVIENRKKKKPEYRRILFEDQPFEDNYVSKDFLKWLLKKSDNVRIEYYDYWLCVTEVCPVVEQLSLVLIYWNVFEVINNNLISIEVFCGIEYILFFIGYVLFNIFEENRTRRKETIIWKCFRTFLLVLILFYLSPLLQTLTRSISSDTIQAMVFFLLLIHLFTHDYTYINGYTKTFRCTLSLNSVVFSSILLASRMDTCLQTFGFISFAILIFAVLPVLRNWLNQSTQQEEKYEKKKEEQEEDQQKKEKIPNSRSLLSYFFTFLVVCSSNIILYELHPLKHVLLFWFSVVFIMFAIPGVLIWIQSGIRKKCSFKGPWDAVTLLNLETDFE